MPRILRPLTLIKSIVVLSVVRAQLNKRLEIEGEQRLSKREAGRIACALTDVGQP